jgi:hypothetical protein
MSTPVPTKCIIPIPPTRVTTFFTVDTSEPLTFQWTKQMPNKGHLGTVTFRQFQKKPIQVFEPKGVETFGVCLGISWAFQAQDGSFLCRLFVSNFGDVFITFSEPKKGDFPIITLLAPHHPPIGDATGQNLQSSSPESNQVT